MPGFDRTGPMGAGPMTGGARGWCNSQRRGAPSNYGGAGYRGGMGLRRGFRGGGRSGMGRGRAFGPNACWYPPVAAADYAMQPADELEYLRQRAADMSVELEAVNRRIDAISKDSMPAESE